MPSSQLLTAPAYMWYLVGILALQLQFSCVLVILFGGSFVLGVEEEADAGSGLRSLTFKKLEELSAPMATKVKTYLNRHPLSSAAIEYAVRFEKIVITSTTEEGGEGGEVEEVVESVTAYKVFHQHGDSVPGWKRECGGEDDEVYVLADTFMASGAMPASGGSAETVKRHRELWTDLLNNPILQLKKGEPRFGQFNRVYIRRDDENNQQDGGGVVVVGYETMDEHTFNTLGVPSQWKGKLQLIDYALLLANQDDHFLDEKHLFDYRWLIESPLFGGDILQDGCAEKVVTELRLSDKAHNYKVFIFRRFNERPLMLGYLKHSLASPRPESKKEILASKGGMKYSSYFQVMEFQPFSTLNHAQVPAVMLQMAKEFIKWVDEQVYGEEKLGYGFMFFPHPDVKYSEKWVGIFNKALKHNQLGYSGELQMTADPRHTARRYFDLFHEE